MGPIDLDYLERLLDLLRDKGVRDFDCTEFSLTLDDLEVDVALEDDDGDFSTEDTEPLELAVRRARKPS